MDNQTSIGNRIKLLREELGLTQEQFGKEICRDKSIISKIEGEKVELSSSICRAIGRAFDIQEKWLLTGEGPKTKEDAEIALYEQCREVMRRKSSHPNKKRWARGQQPPIQPDFPSDDFVLIRQVNGKISAGGGVMPDESVDLLAAFRKDWIKRKGGKPERMSLIKVDGDSMEPTLLSGDLVLVDHGRDSIASQGGIYAIAIDDEIMIKRVQPVIPDKLLVISDNKQYPPFEVSRNAVRINGKVIWYAREMER
ncbi:MAG: XRE family transcriptional regulator [Syntrophales bacterium]